MVPDSRLPVLAEVNPPAEVNTRWHWVVIMTAVVITVLSIVMVALTVWPPESAGLVALVIAATAFPAIAVWASRVSSIELAQAVAQSAKARNELLGIGLANLTEEIRKAGNGQAKTVVAAIVAAQSQAEEVGKSMVRGIASLKETIQKVGEAEVQAMGEARAASERSVQAARELADIQLKAEERARPLFYVQAQVRSHLLFFRHNILMVANAASPGSGVVVSYKFLEQNAWTRIPRPAFDLGTQGQQEFDIGDIAVPGASNRVWVKLEYRDDALHRHVATVDIPLGVNQWVLAPHHTIS